MRTESLCKLIFLIAFSFLIFGLYGCGGGGGGTTTPSSGNSAPATVTLLNPTSKTASSMALLWTQSNESDFASYNLYYSAHPGVNQSSTLAATIMSKTTTSATVSGLSASTLYYFKVFICDAIQCTGSNEVSGTIESTTANTWSKTFGGTGTDIAMSVQQTSGRGFIVAGYTYSYGTGDSDFWILKLDSSGNQAWAKTFGGIYADQAWSIKQTSDAGLIVAGSTKSYGAGGSDFWVLKLDSSGNQTWAKTLGGTGDDVAQSVQQTSDGGFIVAGSTKSYGAGGSDFWVLKLDSSGNQTWAKTFGGTGDDTAHSVQQTSDGGYIVAGQKESSVGSGNKVMWVLKLNSSGDSVWAKTLSGGSQYDGAWSVQQTADSGYIVAGAIIPSGELLLVDRVLKLDSYGNQTWAKSFGAAGAASVQQTTDGGFIVAGDTYPNFTGWVQKLDASGNQLWANTFTEYHVINSVQQTTDGGFIMAGNTMQSDFNYWVLKLDASGNCQGCDVTTNPPSAVTLSNPQNITSSSMTLSWSQSTDNDFVSYMIYRDTSTGVSQSSTLINTVTTKTTTAFSVTSLSALTTYYYKVFVCNSYGQCTGSNEINGTTSFNDPLAVTLNNPSNITSSSMMLSWTQSTESHFSSYQLYRATSPGVSRYSTLVTSFPSNTTINTTASSLAAATQYFFKVYVCSPWSCTGSNEVHGTTSQ
jgi:predicted secreted protein